MCFIIQIEKTNLTKMMKTLMSICRTWNLGIKAFDSLT